MIDLIKLEDDIIGVFKDTDNICVYVMDQAYFWVEVKIEFYENDFAFSPSAVFDRFYDLREWNIKKIVSDVKDNAYKDWR